MQWKVGDQCFAVWSKDNNLYKATIIEADEEKRVCKVKYDDYNEEEERPWEAICPVYGRRFSGDDRYHQNRQKREKREEHGRVVIYIHCLLRQMAAQVCAIR